MAPRARAVLTVLVPTEMRKNGNLYHLVCRSPFRNATRMGSSRTGFGTVRRVTDTQAVRAQVPLVDYLVLGDSPHLVANQCTSCGARFFDRRNACAGCFGTSFEKVDVAT